MPVLSKRLNMSRKMKAESTSSDESEVERVTSNPSRYIVNTQSNKMSDQTTSSDESEEETTLNLKDARKRFNRAQKNVQIMDEILLRLQVEMNRVEVQWLQLSNMAKSQQSNSSEQKKIELHFKDAEDINATNVDLAISPKEYKDSYDSDLE